VNVTVVARHIEITDAMKRHAQEKAGKLTKFYDGLQSAAVTLDMDAGEYAAEIVATGRRKSVFVARHRGEDLSACVDQCVHKLSEQLRRYKDRVRDRHGPGHDQTMVVEEPPEP